MEARRKEFKEMRSVWANVAERSENNKPVHCTMFH